jgi:hypothetical protein
LFAGGSAFMPAEVARLMALYPNASAYDVSHQHNRASHFSTKR